MRGSRLLAWVGVLALAGCGDDSSSGDTGGQSSSSGDTGGPSSGEPDDTTGPSADSTDTGITSMDTSSSSDGGTTNAEGSSTTETIDPMGLSFFVSSVGNGNGDFGGVTGADAFCQSLAEAVGEGQRTWQAYLSTETEDARDRIGSGPWFNAAGDMIAADPTSLHADGLSNGPPDGPQHALDENGAEVPGNEHDILTGSEEDGTLRAGETCDNWTSSTDQAQGRVGHSDIPGNPRFSPSWNSAHTPSGCDDGSLQGTGGDARVYCFAID